MYEKTYAPQVRVTYRECLLQLIGAKQRQPALGIIIGFKARKANGAIFGTEVGAPVRFQIYGGKNVLSPFNINLGGNEACCAVIRSSQLANLCERYIT